jgi:hypothetical protein
MGRKRKKKSQPVFQPPKPQPWEESASAKVDISLLEEPGLTKRLRVLVTRMDELRAMAPQSFFARLFALEWRSESLSPTLKSEYDTLRAEADAIHSRLYHIAWRKEQYEKSRWGELWSGTSGADEARAPRTERDSWKAPESQPFRFSPEYRPYQPDGPGGQASGP